MFIISAGGEFAGFLNRLNTVCIAAIFAEDWTFLNIVEDKSEKQVESRRVEYFDAGGGHVS